MHPTTQLNKTKSKQNEKQTKQKNKWFKTKLLDSTLGSSSLIARPSLELLPSWHGWHTDLHPQTAELSKPLPLLAKPPMHPLGIAKYHLAKNQAQSLSLNERKEVEESAKEWFSANNESLEAQAPRVCASSWQVGPLQKKMTKLTVFFVGSKTFGEKEIFEGFQ